MRISRRRALAALPALAAAGAVGCSGERPLRIAVVWSGFERRIFQHLLRAYPYPAAVYSAGDNIAALLREPVADTASPDIAMVPRPGLVRDPGICRRLQPVRSSDPPYWRSLVTCEGAVRGVWIKAAHKSLVWHTSGDALSPGTWEAWRSELARQAQAAGAGASPAPLSIGAADGWVLTDWFENVLLGFDPHLGVYESLATGADPEAWRHPAVVNTLRELGELWSTPGLLPGGGSRALTLQFHEAILDVFHYGTALAVAAPDFAWPILREYARDPAEAARAQAEPARVRFRFPPVSGAQPVLVGGEAAVALRADDQRARAFLDWLAAPSSTGAPGTPRDTSARDRALRQWAAEGGFTPVRWRPGYPPLLDEPAREISGRSPSIAFDLSDRLSGGLSGGDGQGLWRILTEFFTAVSVRGVRVPDAVSAATAAMVRAAEGGR